MCLVFTGPSRTVSARSGFENAMVELYGIDPACTRRRLTFSTVD